MAFAVIFNDVGVGEWFVLLAVVLVVMGPKRLPEAARTFGRYYSKIRRAADNFKRQLMEMDVEFDRAVADAEREATEAFTVEDDLPADDIGPAPADSGPSGADVGPVGGGGEKNGSHKEP